MYIRFFSVSAGANFVEDASGKRYDLSRLNDEKRRGLAARLLSVPGQRVWRHLADGDAMLVNRQVGTARRVANSFVLQAISCYSPMIYIIIIH